MLGRNKKSIDECSKWFHKFLFPSINRNGLGRIILVAAGSFLFFSYVLIPLRIQGHSMEPTYLDGSHAFCLRPWYLFTDMKRTDIVTVRFTGKSIMLLKRVLALPGDTLEFREGMLFVNNKKIEEPYVSYHSSWNLPVRKIKPGFVYVAGDNRSTPMSQHHFGQVRVSRIIGAVLF